MTHRFAKILAAIDFDVNLLGALDVAADVARQNAAQLFLLHVVPIAWWRTRLPAYMNTCLAEERLARDELMRIGSEGLVRTDPFKHEGGVQY